MGQQSQAGRAPAMLRQGQHELVQSEGPGNGSRSPQSIGSGGHAAAPSGRVWLLKRNCALTPRQAATWFAAVGSFSLMIGIIFTLQGAWMVLPFSIIENLGLLAAFFWFSRHATDQEKIWAEQGSLRVETQIGPQTNRDETVSSWFRVEYDGGPRELIRVLAGSKEVQVGRFVPHERRALLAKEIRAVLNGAAA